jgi:hypothetical protein
MVFREPVSFFRTEKVECETARSKLRRLSWESDQLTATQAEELRTRLDRGDLINDVTRWLIEELDHPR